MPEFYSYHTPDDVDDFTRGYFAAVEWLLPEQTDSEGNCIGPAPYDKMRGFNPKTRRSIIADCKDFRKTNADDLDLYMTYTGRDMESAGHDFFLTRNRHGAGFWDRGPSSRNLPKADYGNGEACLQRLTKSAHAYGGTHEYLNRSGYLVSE